jgi:hypothetical protein
MSFNLVLNSNDSMYYAGGVARFKVHFGQFMSEAQKYKVSFSFISEVSQALDEDDLFSFNLDNIGAQLKNIGGRQYNSSTSTNIGFILSEEPHSSHVRLRANHSSNPPVDLIGRPDQDILQISFRDLSQALVAKTPQFVAHIRFEHCGCV